MTFKVNFNSIFNCFFIFSNKKCACLTGVYKVYMLALNNLFLPVPDNWTLVLPHPVPPSMSTP